MHTHTHTSTYIVCLAVPVKNAWYFQILRSTRCTAAQLLGTLNVRQFAGAATFL